MSRSVSDLFEPGGETIHSAAPAREMLAQALASSFVLAEDWENTPAAVRATIEQCTHPSTMLSLLEEHGLLTHYQAGRIEAGVTHGLILGNYRILDRLGAGAMGVVFKAEHCRMRNLVAIKVLLLHSEQDHKLLLRFLTEMRAVAQLQHPNIVAAIDTGEVAGNGPHAPVLHYFVMEYVPGEDLEKYVVERGPLPVTRACDLAYQVASALEEAHKHHLVHRDIKPSNVLVTPEEQAKLLDFGLARHFRHRQTGPGILLGTIDYMAPEQTQSAADVDIRADIYALGGTLFWSLTARPPFPSTGTLVQAVTQRMQQAPPLVRGFRPDVPVELEAVLTRMMALKPGDRYATPQAVMRALFPFLKPETHEHFLRSPREALVKAGSPGGTREHRVLVADDEPNIRKLCRCFLESDGLRIAEAEDGVQTLEMVTAALCDLLLLDIDMPNLGGIEVLRRLRELPPCPNLKIVMFSGRASHDEMSNMLLAGADGYLTKPFSRVQLLGQVKPALRLKDAQDRSDLLNHRLLGMNGEMERTLSARDSDLVHARNALVLALAKLIKCRDGETGEHVWRLQRYSRCLAEAAAGVPSFAGQIDTGFIDMLECCAPLHDIGKVGIPDHILLKAGKLTPDERMFMQTHTLIGADTLKEVADHHGSALAFLQMAIDITRSHHEHYDGTGYPDGLTGNDIPLSARIVAIGDVYDALRSRRVYKPALSHAAAVNIITDGSPGHFDPALIQVFHGCAVKMDGIFCELSG
jgi:response regulator RpfG family c-di-GMP phosphodiesterase